MLKNIGKYEIIEELGQGAMGVVYKARDPFIGRMVALKTITGGLSGKPDLLERFYQEARSAGGLQHPNIVTIFEMGKEGDIPYIAMEYLEGESLDKLIARREPMALSQKVSYIVQICGALDYAHKHGLIHRDIKPGNIMLHKEGIVKVVDFGIARVVDTSKTQTGMIIGTLGYMSPQQLRGERADERSDIWAVGAMFYEIICYQRPFNGDNPANLMLNIITQRQRPLHEFVPDCPPEVEALIDRMLDKEAAQRFQSMEDVLLELDPLWRRMQRDRLGELVAESQRLIEDQNLPKAQNLLRQALHLDSSNTQAKSLLEKVSIEIRRVQLLPRIKDQLAKVQNLLDSGRLQEAKVEAESALHLDPGNSSTLELLGQVEKAIRSTQTIQEKMRNTKKRVAEGSLTEAGRLIEEVLAMDAATPGAQELQKHIRSEKQRRDQRKRFTEGMQKARSMWSRAYFDEAIDLLLDLQKEFPQEAEITELLNTARQDKKDEKKQLRLADARNLLDSERFTEALSLLNELGAAYPNDAAVRHLRTLVVQAQESRAKRQRLESELAALRALVSEGKLDEAIKKGEPLVREFPQEKDLLQLVSFVRSELQAIEEKRALDEALKKVRGFVEGGFFQQAIQVAEKALAEHSGNVDLMILLERARTQQKEKDNREFLERRIREIKAKINRDELTDAIDLARETLMTAGNDTDVSQLLHAAEMEHGQREKKKEQDRHVAAAQTLIAEGKFADATRLLNQGLATQLFDPADPRIQNVLREAELERTRPQDQKKKRDPGGTAPSKPGTPKAAPGDPAKDYVYSTPGMHGASGPLSATSPKEASPTGMLATTFGSAATEIQPSKKPATAARGTATLRDESSSVAVQPAAKPVWKKPIPMAVGGVVLASVIGTAVYISTKPAASVRPAQQQSQVAQQVPNAGSTQPETNAAPVTTPQTQPNQASSPQTNAQPPVPAQQVQPQAVTPQQTKPLAPSNESPAPQSQPPKTEAAQTQPAATPPQQIAQQIQPAPVQQPALAPAPPQAQQAPSQPAAATPAAQPQPAPAAPPKPAPVVVAQPTVRLQVSERKKYSGPLNAGQMMSSAFLDANLQLQNHEVPAQVASEAAKGSALTLLLSINEDGRVYEGRVLAGDQQVGSAIVAAAKQSWQFDAPKVNGKSVKTTVSVAVQF